MIVIPRPLFLGISLEDGIETDIKYIMKFTPTMGNQISYWIIQIKSMMSAYMSPDEQIPPLWLTQVKHIHEIIAFSSQPSIPFHLVLICWNTMLHLFYILFWTHKTFNLLFRRHTFSEEMNFNTHHVLKDIASIEKLWKGFCTLNSRKSEIEEENFIIYRCIKIFFVIYDILMVFKVDFIIIVIHVSSNKWPLPSFSPSP